MRKKKRSSAGIIVTIIILIALIFLTNLNVESLSYAEAIFGNLVMPVQNGLTYLKHKISGDGDYALNIDSLTEQNKKLTKENEELSEKLREFEILEAENETLRESLDLTEKYEEYKTVPAYIINKDASNYSSVFVINVGKDDDVDVGMAVISSQGLVGHVISATDTTAKVQTIIDPSSSVSSSISTTSDSIVCKGTLENASLKGMYIPIDANIIIDDRIVTSGMGGIYPKGILIGTIRKVVNTSNITDRYVTVTPAVDFNKLETVLVIINEE